MAPVLGLLLVVLLVPPGVAQQLTADQLLLLQQQIQQRQNGGAGVPSQADLNPPSITLQPTMPQPLPGQQPFNGLPGTAQFAPVPPPPSRVEQILSSRAGVSLRQFGYDQLGRGVPVQVPQTGAVQDDYILGPGDEVVVTLRGQDTNEYRARVDRNGQVTLTRLNPIPASGRSFGAFRRDVETAVARAYVATTAFVSVARIREVSVLVSGEVNAPGQRLVTGLNSVLDAILLSGGVRKSGSLRNVRLQRGGREYVIDLYSVLTDRGMASNFHLTDGDRIRVPVLGPVVAAAGLVRQPGIYELAAGQKSISVRELMSLAGGEEVRGNNRLSLLQLDAAGRSRMVELRDQSGTVGDSEILFVQLGADQTVSLATLSGGTGLAGTYPIVEGTRLSQLLKAPGAPGPSPYTLFGIVARRDPRTLMRTLVAFTPVAVINGGEDMALRSDDIVRVLSTDEIRVVVSTIQDFTRSQAAQQEALRNPVASANIRAPAPANGDANQVVGGTLLTAADTASESSLNQRNAIQSLATRETGPSRERQPAPNAPPGSAEAAPPRTPLDFQQRTGGTYPINREIETFDQLAQQLGVDPLVLTNFLLDHQVTLTGAVRGPGLYLVGPTASLQDVVAAAGGTFNWTDASGVELISTVVDPAAGRSVTSRSRLALNQANMISYVVKPRDEFRFNQVFSDIDLGNITVQGEVRFTGSYRLTRGERLSDLLARAGGLTTAAYPFGTVFLRKSTAALEREGYLRTAREVEDQLVSAMARVGNNRLDPAAFASIRTFVSELRQQIPLGRVSVVADPSLLASRPDLDPLLEAGDVIYIPQRPSTVSVLGQVMQAGSFPYRAGETVGDYIARAGGYSRFADESQTFIVLPDGTARKVERSWLRFDAATALPPGSAIVVPRDLVPFDWRQTLIDVSQIFSQFAVSIASVAVLSKQ